MPCIVKVIIPLALAMFKHKLWVDLDVLPSGLNLILELLLLELLGRYDWLSIALVILKIPGLSRHSHILVEGVQIL